MSYVLRADPMLHFRGLVVRVWQASTGLADLTGLTGFSDRFVYRAQQAALLRFFLALQRRYGVLRDPAAAPALAPGTALRLRRRYEALLERDLANVRAGFYPRALLYGFPLARYVVQLPALARDAPAVARRRAARRWEDLPDGAGAASYPPYYRRNFHWQTDGYLSRGSAELYDLDVEMVFLGTADVMRRQVIPPISRMLRATGDTRARLLDVGCGTGRLLLQIAAAHPALALTGVDLSPFYVDAARRLLDRRCRVELVSANAEALPLPDASFDVVTSVFVLHELPPTVRRAVLAEMGRVLRPGGLLVIADSVQGCDGPELAPLTSRFSETFHEPFYDDYVSEDLATRVADAGFEVTSVQQCFLAKVVAAVKSPAR